jgi:hypothetical protein
VTKYLTLFLMALWVFALVDVARTPQRQVRLLPKWLWLLLVAFTWIIGATIWLLCGRAPLSSPPRNRGAGDDPRGGPGGIGPRRGGPPASGPVAPDDDPAFLRHLDEQTWRARMEQLRRERATRADEAEGPDPAN